jgi:uroporphyrin-3 C-methyltransferase
MSASPSPPPPLDADAVLVDPDPAGFRESRPPPRALFATRLALAIVTLVLLAAGTAAWLDASRETTALRGEVARKLTEADAALAESRARESNLAGELREAQAKLALLEVRLGESQAQQAALEALYRDLAPSRDDLTLTEVEQVLYLASQQLALAGNVQAALTALQLADAKLARSDRPEFAPLRRALARDMDRLKAVPYTDVAGLALKLDQTLALVDSLPLARDERLPEPAPEMPPAAQPAWLRALAELWGELRSLVRLETSDRPAAALLAPREQYFLRENLRLRLLSARIALLARQEASFRADVKAAQAILKDYFDARAKPVKAVSDALAQMLAAPLPAEPPELTASIDAARALKIAQERRSERPPEKRAR